MLLTNTIYVVKSISWFRIYINKKLSGPEIKKIHTSHKTEHLSIATFSRNYACTVIFDISMIVFVYCLGYYHKPVCYWKKLENENDEKMHQMKQMTKIEKNENVEKKL
jgi:hypothetical protein